MQYKNNPAYSFRDIVCLTFPTLYYYAQSAQEQYHEQKEVPSSMVVVWAAVIGIIFISCQ